MFLLCLVCLLGMVLGVHLQRAKNKGPGNALTPCFYYWRAIWGSNPGPLVPEAEFSKKLAKRKPLIFGLISRYINYLGPTSQFHLFPSIL